MVKGEDGGMRKCGDTLKHVQGGPTTNLLKHMKSKHPEEARRCLESSKHSQAYRAKLDAMRSFARPDGSGTTAAAPPQSRNDAPTTSRQVGETPSDTESWERSCVWMCAVDLRPPKTLTEPGFQLLANRVLGGRPTPRFGDNEYRRGLERECIKTEQALTRLLTEQREFVPFGPCCSLQLDTWELPSGLQNEHLVTVLTATLVSPAFQYRVVGLGVQAFGAKNGPEDVAAWVRARVAKYWGDGATPADVAMAITVGQGDVLPAAVTLLGVPCLRCLHVFLQHATHASLEESGTGKLSDFFVRALALSEKLTNARKRAPHARVSIKAELKDVNRTVDKLSRLLALPSNFSVDAEALGILLEEEDAGLVKADWRRLQDLLGVLEAVCEVDSAILEGQRAAFAAVATQMTELQEYLTEDIVYVPVAHEQEGEELNRLERPVTEVDALVLELRTAVVRHLQDDLPRDETTERLRALSLMLSPSQRADAQQQLGSDCEMEAMRLLEQEYRKACERMEVKPSPSNGDDREWLKQKRPWRGILDAYKHQKLEQEGQREVHQEIQMYLSITEGEQLEVEQDALSWWAEHTQCPDTASSMSSDGTPLPVLSRLAAQYHSLSPCALQASLLMGGMQRRMEELLEVLPWPTVQSMLFLRLNRALLHETEREPSP